MKEASASTYRLGLLLVTGSAIAWSTTGLFTRLIPLDAATMLVWRGLFGAAGLLLVIAALGGLASFGRLGWPGILYTLVSAAAMLCFITSFRHTTVAHVAIVYATVPFVAAGLAWLALRERPSGSAILASLAALAGVAFMVGAGHDGGLLGDLLAFAMTTGMASLMVLARAYPGIPTLPAACLSALLAAAVAAPFGGPLTVSAPDLALLALFGLSNSAVGMALFMLGSRLLPAIETALIGALETPLAPIWVWLAFGETPDWATLAGGSVVFGAVLMHIIWTSRQGAET